MIPILPSTAWREYRGSPSKKGLNQTTHQAMIADATGKLHHCYVKVCPSNFPTPLTEALGWLLAKSLNLPRPEFAALIMLPLDKLRGCMPLDQHWLNYPTNEILSFCSSAVDGRSVSHGWRWFAHIRTKNIFNKTEVAKISAFDHWVDNQDRNTGNLIINSNGHCVPIDNEYILYSLLWNGQVPFGIVHNSLLSEGARYLHGESLDRFKVEMALQGKLHEAALQLAIPELRQLVFSLVPDPHKANLLWNNIQHFLSSRAHPDWLSNELKVIV